MCTGIKEVVLPNELISIEDGLLWKDESLLKVNIPSGLKEIGHSVFVGCDSLSEIDSYMTVPCSYYSSSIFETNVYNNATLYVPKGTKTDYTKHNYWYKFKNIVETSWYTEDGNEPIVPNGWEKVITNGNLATDDLSCYYKVESRSDLMPAIISEGTGKNNSRGIVIRSGDNPENNWDTMFFIRIKKKLGHGTKMHIEFDYKASQNAECQTLAFSEPQEYLYWQLFGDINFTTNWQHFSTDVDITDYLVGMQTIGFNLAINTTATNYYFDNIVVWVQDPTSIHDVRSTDNQNHNIYNISGQRREKLQKGINIINGKKIIKK